jgi:hypothetical protein
MEIADPTKLEAAAELTADQVHLLQQGQPAEISLLSRPDVSMSAVARLLPAGVGAGGSGAVQGQDHTTRFAVNNTNGQRLTPGAVVKIHMILERKQNVLWLPPAAIRAFEGRRFVEVREGDRTRRAPITVGIETPTQAEITEGLKEGDVIVGQ